MKVLLVALATLVFAGCAVVPAPVPVPVPGVSIGVGPVYGGGYYHRPYRGYYGHYPYAYRYWR